MTKFHLFSQDSVRLETAPTGVVRKSYLISLRAKVRIVSALLQVLQLDFVPIPRILGICPGQ